MNNKKPVKLTHINHKFGENWKHLTNVPILKQGLLTHTQSEEKAVLYVHTAIYLSQ